MRLASDILTISHGGIVVRLCPSLRAALQLQRIAELPKLFRLISDGNLDTIATVFEIAADDIAVARRVFDLKVQAHALNAVAEFRTVLFLFLIQTFGVEETGNAKPQKQSNAKVDIEKSLTQLFEIGTGWLGWTPAATWAATPAEIMAGHRGLIAKLSAINGGGKAKADEYDPTEEVSLEEVAEGIAKLRRLSGRA